MMTTSAFEILGPIMVGPSSSHTAGALRLATVARTLAPGTIKHVTFTLYNSFSATYQGHGTDRALVAGILGFDTFDTRIKESFTYAHEAGIDFEFVCAGADPGLHPNTVVITMECKGGTVSVQGESLGGGRIQLSSIEGIEVEISGAYPTIFVTHKDCTGVLARLTTLISESATNIATMRTYRKDKGGMAYTIFETDEMPSDELIDLFKSAPHVKSVCVVRVPGAASAASSANLTLNFDNAEQLLNLCDKHGLTIGQLMRKREFELADGTYDPDQKMQDVLDVMRTETRSTIEHPERSLGGLLFGQAREVYNSSVGLMGDVLTRAVAYGMATLERSATMGIIVASPTAGSAGVVPGAVLASAEAQELDDEAIKELLWCSCAIGAILARNASVSGAEGGCQAEVGSASAMAAAALVEQYGGSPECALDAASIAIGNLLGLVCDPVRGLVEYPCQNRNAIGICDAYSAAQLALAGIGNPLPFDEVAEAMRKVGISLPEPLRETALGGLAACPSAGCAGSACKGCCG